jgi:hypothetical protein
MHGKLKISCSIFFNNLPCRLKSSLHAFGCLASPDIHGRMGFIGNTYRLPVLGLLETGTDPLWLEGRMLLGFITVVLKI